MLSKSVRLVLALTGLLGTAGVAFAGSPWEQAHPRRGQVNDRLENQGAHIGHDRIDHDRIDHDRIDHDWREHEITSRRARALHEQEARIRAHERMMAARDNGHITRHDRERLNHQENAERREIGR